MNILLNEIKIFHKLSLESKYKIETPLRFLNSPFSPNIFQADVI